MNAADAYNDAASIVERANIGLHQSAMLDHLAQEIRARTDAAYAPIGPITVGDLHGIMKVRALRTNYLPHDLFRECAWNILLLLYAEQTSNRRLSVSALCSAAYAPTTGLRWIQQMTAAGMLVREPDARDKRRVWIWLSPSTLAAMDAYFDAIRVRAGALRLIL